MSQASDEIMRELYRLRADNERMKTLLSDIADHAQDNYDGPEDRTHAPYLRMAQEGLGTFP